MWLGLSGLILMILKSTKVISMFQVETEFKKVTSLAQSPWNSRISFSQLCYTAVLNRREKARQGKVVRGSEVLGSSLLSRPLKPVSVLWRSSA